MGERLGLVDQLHFADQHFGVGRHFDACHLGDFRCGLPHDGRVQTAVFQDDVLNRFQFFTLQQIAAVGSEAFAYRIINRVDDDNRLFGSADNAAVEGFGHQDRGDHALDVCGFVYHDRGITGTDADGRLAGAVGCLHHARPPVARIRLMSGWCISWLDSSTVGWSIQPMMSLARRRR